MIKKNIFVVCATCRDRRELALDKFKENYTIFFQDYDDGILDKIICGQIKDVQDPFNAAEKIRDLLNFCETHSIEGVVSTDDYPGSIYANVIAYHLGLPGASPESVLTCQHKYYSRIAQKKYVPEATPDFWLIDPNKTAEEIAVTFPFFIKPVKSSFSIFADKIANMSELKSAIKYSIPPELFLRQINWLLAKYTMYKLNANYLLAETLLQGVQVTVEGYSYQGQIEIMGIVDSIMYPGTNSFQRFAYPSFLPETVQRRMHEVAKKIIQGINFDNSLFNIEMMYNPESNEIHIIEINPRMCSQFADLYEKVDGTNTYQTIINLALGKKPSFTHKNGKYGAAASFVLRRFSNGQVLKIPTQQQIQNFYEKYPEARVEIHVKEGEYLNSVIQDGKSYRYALIHLGAATHKELQNKFEQCKELLPFVFNDID